MKQFENTFVVEKEIEEIILENGTFPTTIFYLIHIIIQKNKPQEVAKNFEATNEIANFEEFETQLEELVLIGQAVKVVGRCLKVEDNIPTPLYDVYIDSIENV